MNETILNGLLNLFAIFASLAKIESDQARQAVNSYLTSHFGIRSHKEYMELFDEIQVFTMIRTSISIERMLLSTYATSSSQN